MTENVFVKYLSKKVLKEKAKIFEPGPVITISRQYGCYATSIATKLAKKLSFVSPNPWDFITKEVIEDSAKKLEVEEQHIAHIFGADEKGFLGDLIVSFSNKTYKSDAVIIRTIRSVVRKYAEQGSCVIVGRAGCIIAEDIEKALHVRLVAPFEYRMNNVKNRLKLNEKEATQNVLDTDKKRLNFMKFFRGDKPDDEIFDLMLNREKLTDDEIVETIFSLAEFRKLI
jgi:cytidylate kinase